MFVYGSNSLIHCYMIFICITSSVNHHFDIHCVVRLLLDQYQLVEQHCLYFLTGITTLKGLCYSVLTRFISACKEVVFVRHVVMD